MLSFYPDVKKILEYFFFLSFQGFLKEYPVILILIPKVWTEEMKLFALHISYKIMIYSFLFWPESGPYIRIRIRKFIRIRTGQKHAVRIQIRIRITEGMK